jgi:uncharacterized protein YndB with AHSA1/START domain
MSKFLSLACAGLLGLSAACAPLAEPPPSEDGEIAVKEAELGQNLEPRVPGKLSVLFRAEAVIDASAADVWEVITDFESYSAWNPWVTRAVGESTPGSEVEVDVMMGSSKMTVTHTVLNGEIDRRYCWKDSGFNAIFVYGQRCRTLTLRDDGRVHYEVELLIDGAMSHIAALFYGENLKNGLAKETPALKLRAEQLAGTAP